jgi:hypothetical protein
MYTYMYIHTNLYRHTHTSISVYVYVCVCAFIYTYPLEDGLGVKDCGGHELRAVGHREKYLPVPGEGCRV